MTEANPIPPQFSLQILQDYIKLHTIVTGTLPKEIRVSQDLLNWFREQRKSIAKNFNMGTISNKDTDLQFMEVKLIPILELT